MNKAAQLRNKHDVSVIMSRIHANGGNYWATKENGTGKGSPFSTKDAAIMLHELGLKKKDPVVKGIADTIFNTWREDGRFKIAPTGGMYPCQTIGSARALCYLGYAKDKRIRKTFEYLLSIQESDGGWRCNKFSFGRGPETNHSNPGPTLEALDAFRFTDLLNSDEDLDQAVEFLLKHWKTKKPIGPCLFGIGTLFMQVEFPFFRYNLFYYCYVLSFYNKAIGDKRFREALKELECKLVDGNMIVKNPNRQLADLNICRKAKPSEIATSRFEQILERVRKA